jgi:hypothetical protein
MILWKHIKPAEIKAKEMRFAILRAMDKTGTDVKKDFKKTTATWKHKPVFDVIISTRGGNLQTAVFTIDTRYWMVDQGTKEHIIPFDVRKSKPLVFGDKFTPKTVPGVIGSGPGFRGGNRVVYRVVRHPGAKARNFSVTIWDMWIMQYHERIEAAMAAAAAASGHGG